MYTDYLTEYDASKENGSKHYVSFYKFRDLRPPFVKTLKAREVCLAVPDIHTRHLVEDLHRNIRKWKDTATKDSLCLSQPPTLSASLNLSQACSCDGALGCADKIPAYSSQLGKSLLCPRDETTGWHHRRCVDSSCTDCGWDNKLTRCPFMFNNIEDAHWRKYEPTPHPKASSQKAWVAAKYKDKTLLTEVCPTTLHLSS